MRVAISSGNCIECPQSLVQSYPARGAFTARLGMSEFDKVAGDIYHAVVFVHHHHATRAHDRADLRQALIVHLRRSATVPGFLASAASSTLATAGRSSHPRQHSLYWP